VSDNLSILPDEISNTEATTGALYETSYAVQVQLGFIGLRNMESQIA
jgi:hypothetical protein